MRSGTVLLVEDDPVLVRLLMMLMQMSGLDVVHAPDSRTALDLVDLRGDEISLVVCDVNLQGESGPAVVTRIRACLPQIKTLYISGFPFENLCELGLLSRSVLCNADTNYLQKPFLPAQLQNAIDSLLTGAPEPGPETRNEQRTGVLHASAAY